MDGKNDETLYVVSELVERVKRRLEISNKELEGLMKQPKRPYQELTSYKQALEKM